MPRNISIKLGRAKATAELLEDAAPKTCDFVWRMLPITGKTGHSMESGREVFVELRKSLDIEPENRTIYQIPGDIQIYCKPVFPPLEGPPVPVISYIYDRDSQIRDVRGPIPVNLFAHVTHGLNHLASESILMRREGFKRALIERA